MTNPKFFNNLSPLPVTYLIVWMCAAITVQQLSAPVLAAVTVALFLVAYKLHDQRLFKLLRRTRWIFLSLLVIYAFLTPGSPLWSLSNMPSPTVEGLEDGLMQLGRLLSVLAGLSILLTLLSREQLISGIYSLIYPVHFLGGSRKKIAVRLALTLHYAETAMRDTAVDWQDAIRNALASTHYDEASIAISAQPRSLIDIVLIAFSGALLLGAWT
ncbi:MAG: CbiQ family ECF transporter T component [Gallionellaceae bacterium]|nr:CbiQ family ECF transporter T component [Gallionellaceae bacterium]